LRFSYQEAASFTFQAVRNTAKMLISMLVSQDIKKSFLEVYLIWRHVVRNRLLENPFDSVIENLSANLGEGLVLWTP